MQQANNAITLSTPKRHVLRAWWQRQPKSFAQICRQLDAEYHLPRPATAQHLPAYQALLALLGVFGEVMLLVSAGVFAGWLFVQAAQWLAFSLALELVAHGLAILTVLVALAEAVQLWLPYYQLQQRVTRMLETLTFEQLEMVIKYAESLNRNAGSAFDNELVVLLEDEISAA